MEKEKNFEYDEEIDSLTIYHDKSETEPVLGSFSVGNLIFDIGVSGSFVSLEIDNASQVFDLMPKDFSKIKNASIRTVLQHNVILLVYSILVNNKEYERSLMIPKNKIQIVST